MPWPLGLTQGNHLPNSWNCPLRMACENSTYGLVVVIFWNGSSQRPLVVCYNLSLFKSSYMFLRRKSSAFLWKLSYCFLCFANAACTVRSTMSVKSLVLRYFFLFHSAGIPEDAELEVKQFSHGQSNPTYLLILPDRKLVLRKKPPGTSFCFLQCFGSMTFWCRSGFRSGHADPCLWLMDLDSDPDPDAYSDPAIFVIDLQDSNKKLI